MNCKRCGISTPRLTVDQRYCRQCAHEVATIERIDAERAKKAERFSVGKDLSGRAAIR